MSPSPHVVAAAAAVLSGCAAFAQVTRYVAPCGDDAWTGLNTSCTAPDGPKRTVQAAIDASSNADTVCLEDGTYTGDGNRDITFGGRAITLKSKNGSTLCILDAGGTPAEPHRVFHLQAGEGPETRIEGLTIRAGYAPGDAGSGMLLEGASPVIVSCVFTANGVSSSSFRGGGVATSGGNPTFVTSVFAGNGGSGTAGGGASIHGNALFDRCIFIGNDAHLGGGAEVVGGNVEFRECLLRGNDATDAGGGLHAQGAGVLLTAGHVDANTAQRGAGAYTTSSFFEARNTLAENNNAANVGGGLKAVGGIVRLKNCILRANNAAAGQGAAILAEAGAALALSECLLTGNATSGATGPGHVVHAMLDTAEIRGCTVANNGGSPGASALELSSSAIVANTILWANAGAPLSGPGSIDYCIVQGGYAGTGTSDRDPMFVAAGAGNFRLRPSSPAIDAGSNAHITVGVMLDLDSNTRRRDDPGKVDTGAGEPPLVDIGAYEFMGVTCYPDCTQSGSLTIADFACFQNRYTAADPYADCNNSGTLTVADFGCFQTAFVGGCP